jgi:tRNA A-37 threonylcarbamoyl transferase component Bud32
MLAFACAACGQRLQLPQGPLGSKVRCPHCQQVVALPPELAGSLTHANVVASSSPLQTTPEGQPVAFAPPTGGPAAAEDPGTVSIMAQGHTEAASPPSAAPEPSAAGSQPEVRARRESQQEPAESGAVSETGANLDRLVERFEQAWEIGKPLDIATLLPDDPEQRRTVLVELIHVELEWRLKAGDSARVEDYLGRFPELAQRERAVLDLIVAEHRFRRRRDPQLTSDEYLRRFPSLRIALLPLLEAVSPSSGPRSDDTLAAQGFGTTDKPVRSVAEVIAVLREVPLLDAAKLAELDELHGGFDSPRMLAEELRRRGWLTAFQADELLQGRGRSLILGTYRVLERLGEGGMGQVFLAEDALLQRKVALKLIRPETASASARQRFLREARVAAAITHDHIIHIYQVGEDHGTPYMAMQLLEGEPLNERLQRQPRLPLHEVRRIGREIALGLSAAHKRGLMHRDIKPANVWLEAETGRVKILDFGLARATGDDSHLTQEGAIVGTPAFMAPEQARGETVDARCDLFSLGVVLYRLCTGKMPFQGKDSVSTLLAVATQEPSAPCEVNSEVPAALSGLVMQLLAKDPAGRPASAQAVAEALAGMEPERTVVLAAGQSAPSRTVPVEASTAAVPRRRRGLLVGAALALVLLGVGLLAPQVIRIYKDGKKVAEVEGDTVEVERPGQPRIKIPVDEGGPRDPKKVQPVLVTSPLNELRRERIPPHELAAAGGGDPKRAPFGLVGVIGDSRLRHWDTIRDLAFSPDGKRLASASADYSVKGQLPVHSERFSASTSRTVEEYSI